MCGYARRHIKTVDLIEFTKTIGLVKAHQFDDVSDELLHFRPAFGGAAYQQIKDLIVREDGQLKAVDATWWYERKEEEG